MAAQKNEPAPDRIAAPPAPADAVPDGPADEAELRRVNALYVQQLVASGLAAVDRVLATVGPADESNSERSARTLAAVARALQEMSAMSEPEDETPQDDNDNDDDPLPRDIDEIREALARRLHALVDAEAGPDDAGLVAGDLVRR